MATIYLASGNPHKAEEFQALVEAHRLGLHIASAREVGGMPAVDEDAGSFVGNARKKARALHAVLPAPGWVLADDSGLCVDALGGAPGVESAYYAGPAGDAAANLRKLVDVMHTVPPPQRRAHFTCVLVLLGPAGEERVFSGQCDGVLALAPRGGGGFGYDPLFIPDGFEQTVAELPAASKHALSHRGRAWRQLAAWWQQQP